MAEKPIELPSIGVPLADTHAHLDMLEDPALALANAAVAGIGLVVTVIDLTENPTVTFERMPEWLYAAASMLEVPDGVGLIATPTPGVELPSVRVIAGIHPHNAADWDISAEATLRALAVNPLVVGLGETGLDFHYDHSPRDDQRAAFRASLALCHELKLPATVHLREAHEEGLAIIRDAGVPPAGCILHCFTEGPALAEAFLELGCMISFAGPVTFSKAEQIREAARLVPLDRMLVETDCPFLAPHPHRGRSNEPALTALTAAVIAELKEVPLAEFAAVTTANARRVFGLTSEGPISPLGDGA